MGPGCKYTLNDTAVQSNEAATIAKFMDRYIPNNGGFPADFSGSSSDTTSWNTVSPSSRDTPSEIFSPHSGGSQNAVNPSTVRTVDGNADVVR